MDAEELSIVNPNPKKLPGPTLLHHLVPGPSDFKALEYFAQHHRTVYSYSELHEASDKVANLLINLFGRIEHADTEVIVPVLVPQCPLLYISLLGTLKAGYAFCPVNDEAPPERIKLILQDISAKVALVSGALASKIPPNSEVHVLCVDEILVLDASPSLGLLPRALSPERLAYVMYTSGSTGRPKGVGISHFSVTQALLAHDRHLPKFDRFLQFASPSFDVSVFEIFFTFFRKSTLIVVERQELLSDLPSALRNMEVDACELTPTVACGLLKTRENAPKLKLLMTIGEPMRNSILNHFGGSNSQKSILWPMYGPTEATIHCLIDTAVLSESPASCIGIPLDTVSCFVISSISGNSKSNEDFRILPKGEAGELAVGGHQLANGYLNLREETSLSFISTPYGRLYRTGDLARMASDGKLHFLGRITDGQIKLRGQRVELGEIEQVVLKTVGCQSSLAQLIESSLVIFCAVSEDVQEEEIHKICKIWLPRYMWPAFYILLPEFPRLPSGKADVKTLRKIFGHRAMALKKHSKYAGHTNNIALDMISKFLGRRIRGDMAISSVGIDSLTAISLATCLRNGGFDTSATEILQSEAVSDLCLGLRSTFEKPNHNAYAYQGRPERALEDFFSTYSAFSSLKDIIEDTMPCTALQSAMLAETAREPKLNCNEIEFEVHSTISIANLVSSITRVIQSNEILRSGFFHSQGEFYAVIFESLQPNQLRITDRIQRGFACSTPADFLMPLKIQIVDGKQNQNHKMMLQAHHAIYDGWSIDLIATDIAKLLGSFSQIVPRPQFRKVLKHYHEQVSLEERNDTLKFWSEQLLGYKKTKFPDLSVSNVVLDNEVGTETLVVNINPKLVRQIAANRNLSSQSYLQAALAICWSGICGESDILIGSVASGRTIPVTGIEDIIGPCIAAIPLRINLGALVTNSELLEYIHQINRASLSHMSLSNIELKKLASVHPKDSLYDILISYEEPLIPLKKDPELLKEIHHVDRLPSKLLFSFKPLGDAYNVQITYALGLVTCTFIHECFLPQFTGALTELLRNETKQVLSTKGHVFSKPSVCHASEAEMRIETNVATIFEQAALRCPEMNALCVLHQVDDTGSAQLSSLSFKKLDYLANCLANCIISVGGNVGEIIAIVMRKSLPLYISILGVLKAGCGYLPLLPDVSAAQVREILERFKVRFCLLEGLFGDDEYPSLGNVRPIIFDVYELEKFSSNCPSITHNLSTIATIIFSSENAGNPEAVAITHNGVVSNMQHLTSICPISSSRGQARLLQACSQAFDMSIFEIFFAWCAGMCLCIAETDALFGNLETIVTRLEITHLCLTPTVAAFLDPKKVKSVEFLLTVGGPMSEAIIHRWGNQLWYGNGHSETTNLCSITKVSAKDSIKHIGRAFPNTSVIVLEANTLQPVPIGWAGELCFGGRQLALEYPAEPTMNSKKFICHPLYGKLYKSGDLGRMLPDGSLLIASRANNQINLRGQTIDSNEISSIIINAGLANAVAIVKITAKRASIEKIACFFSRLIGSHKANCLEVYEGVNSELSEILSSRVPLYMLPSYLIPISHIPLDINGKPDHVQLRECYDKLSKEYLEKASKACHNFPSREIWSDIERRIRDVMAQELNVLPHEIGLWTPLASIGLDSLTAIRISSVLGSVLQIRVSISMLLESHCISRLAKSVLHENLITYEVKPFHILGMKDLHFTPENPAIISDILPCTPLQEVMLSQTTEGYYSSILLRLQIPPDKVILYWNYLTSRLDILRTCFFTTRIKAHPIAQVVLGEWKIRQEVVKVDNAPLKDYISMSAKTLPEELNTGIPPIFLKFLLYKQANYLLLNIHHALYDEIAISMILRQIELLENGQELQPALPFRQFIEHALSLPDDVEDFWADFFRGYQPLTVFPRPHLTSCRPIKIMNLGTLSKVQTKLKSIGISFLSLLQAVWATLLRIASNASDVAFGIVVSGRTIPLDGLERLVAPCFNIIPVRVKLWKHPHNIGVLRYFQNLSLKIHRYQFTSIRRIKRILNCPGENLFNTILILQRSDMELDGDIWSLEHESGIIGQPLICEIVPRPKQDDIIVKLHSDFENQDEKSSDVIGEMFKIIFNFILEFPSAKQLNKDQIPHCLFTEIERFTASPEIERRNEAYSWQEFSLNIETDIQQAFADCSGIPASSISPQTTIFQLGFDSITSIEIVHALRNQGLKLSTVDVIECPNYASLAKRIVENTELATVAETKIDFGKFQEDIRSQVPSWQNIESVLPCTPMQSAMLTSFINSNGRHYLSCLQYRLDTNININDIINAWESLYRRHPMLRTGFVSVDHNYSAFAMLRHTPESFQTPIIRINCINQVLENQRTWEAETTKFLLENLHMPQWRLAFFRDRNNLLMTVILHHALFDARSLEDILDEISAYCHGTFRHIPPIEPTLQKLLALTAASSEESKTFWENLAEKIVVNDFPKMTPLREESTINKMYESNFCFSVSTCSNIVRSLGVSLQAVIQATWTRILAAYTGHCSVTFGVNFSEFETEHSQISSFPCLNTVPIIATNLDSNRALLQSMMDFNTKLYRHRFCSLNNVQKWVGYPARRIFNTILIYRKEGRKNHIVRPWTALREETIIEYPISLVITMTAKDKISLLLVGSESVLPTEQAHILMKQFEATFNFLLMSPDGSEIELYSLNPELYSAIPARVSEISSEAQFLHDFVELQSLSHPDAIAIEFVEDINAGCIRSQKLTYSELNKLSNQAANIFLECAGVGEYIAIHFRKCPEAYISILGILKCGCAFVALDPEAPIKRKEFILSDSKARCLITDNKCSLDFKTSIKVIQIDKKTLMSSCDNKPSRKDGLAPSHTCYCLYTSGTTGTPKGCEISHKNAIQCIMAFQEALNGRWHENSRFLQFAGLHFDVSILEQYWSWSVGITLVSAPKHMILDNLAIIINILGITHIDLTPSLANIVQPDETPTLRDGIFITGGELLNNQVINKWASKTFLCNAYGPTETTIGVTMYQNVPSNGLPRNIGQQLSNVGTFVLRPGSEEPVIRGGIGELCISGSLVGKGYLNRPELTEERFAFLRKLGARVYRTGDLVRVLHNGCFNFVGRTDDQKKIRGQRLELEEINHVIRNGIPEAQNVSTLLIQHPNCAKDMLVSFFSTSSTSSGQLSVQSDATWLENRARLACQRLLPAYMVPQCFLMTTFIPLSSNSKVDTSRLVQLFQSHSLKTLARDKYDADSKVDCQRKEICKIIIDACSMISEVEGRLISDSTNILDIGIDSITVTRLSALLREKGLQNATPAALIRHPIVSEVAEVLLSDSMSSSCRNLVENAKQSLRAFQQCYRTFSCNVLGVSVNDIEYIAPCTHLQQALISKALTTEKRGIYFNSFQLQLHFNTDVKKVREVWLDLIGHHSILRSAFLSTPSGYIQVARKSAKVPWFKCISKENKGLLDFLQARTQEWINKSTNHILTPFQLIELHGKKCSSLIVHIFHALYDGHSLDLILKEAKTRYNNEPLEEQSPSFLEALTQGPLWSGDYGRGFWVHHLSSWRPTSSPSQSFQCDEFKTVFRTTYVSRNIIEILRIRKSMSTQTILLALWAIALQRTMPSMLAIGIVVSGRSINLSNAEQVSGPLFNTIPFLTNSIDGHTWASLLQKCEEFLLAVIPFQHVSLKKIQNWCSDGQPIFKNLFVYGEETHNEHGKSPWKVISDVNDPVYPLSLSATGMGSGQIQLHLLAQKRTANEKMLEEMLEIINNTALTVRPDTILRSITEQQENGSIQNKTLAPPNNFAKSVDNSLPSRIEGIIIREEVGILAGVPPEEVSQHTSIFELGLDSIDTMTLHTKLLKRGINLSTLQLLRCQTVSKMTSTLAQTETKSYDLPAISSKLQKIQRKLLIDLETSGIDLEEIELVLPLTPLQESMVIEMVSSDFEHYLSHQIFEICNEISIQGFTLAWNRLVNTYHIARTGFIEVNDNSLDMAYCQVVFRKTVPDVKCFTISDMSEIPNIITSAKQIAIVGGALEGTFQSALVTFGDRHFLVLSMAHALYDGRSIDLMQQDLKMAYYEGLYPDTNPADFYISFVMASDTSEAEQFWKSYLENFTPTILPLKYPLAERLELCLDLDSAHNISDIISYCKKYGVTTQGLCLASWAVVLAEKSKSLDVVFGVVLSGRDTEGTQNLIFPTINTVAVRCIIHGTALSFLRYVEATMADIRDFQTFPLRKALITTKHSLQESFNTLFVFQKRLENESSLLTMVDGEAALPYPICVEAQNLGSQLRWRVASKAQFLSSGEIKYVLRSLDLAMGQFLKCDESHILSFCDDGLSIFGNPRIKAPSPPLQRAPGTAKNENSMQQNQFDLILRAIHCAINQVTDLSIDGKEIATDLYHIGLDSVNIIRVSNLLRKIGIAVKPRDLLKCISVSEVVSKIMQLDHHENPSTSERISLEIQFGIDIGKCASTCNLGKSDIETILPATAMQVFMLTTWQNTGGSLMFSKFDFAVTSSRGISHVQAAWRHLITQSPILRTLFVATGSKSLPWIQFIVNSESLLSGRATQPLVHLKVLENEGNMVIRITIHHALYDAFSLHALIDRLHEEIKEGNSGPEDDISSWVSYCTVPYTLASRLSRKEFWINYLGVSACAPVDTPVSTHERMQYFNKFALSNASAVKEAAAKNGLGCQSLILAAISRLLYEVVCKLESDSKDSVIIGIYLANRASDHEEVPLVYPTLCLVPLKVKVNESDNLLHAASMIHQDINAISQHRRAEVGLWEIFEWTKTKINCFVNVLIKHDNNFECDRNISFIGPENMIEEVPRVDISSDLLTQKWQQNNAVKNAINNSVDVEVLFNEEELSIGVFGPRERISKDEAVELVANTVMHLQNFYS